MPDVKRVKPGPEEYAEQITEARRGGRYGWADYLSERFERDYPAGADA